MNWLKQTFKNIFITQEVTKIVECPHLKRLISISNNPIKNDCDRCWEEYIDKQSNKKIA